MIEHEVFPGSGQQLWNEPILRRACRPGGAGYRAAAGGALPRRWGSAGRGHKLTLLLSAPRPSPCSLGLSHPNVLATHRICVMKLLCDGDSHTDPSMASPTRGATPISGVSREQSLQPSPAQEPAAQQPSKPPAVLAQLTLPPPPRSPFADLQPPAPPAPAGEQQGGQEELQQQSSEQQRWHQAAPPVAASPFTAQAEQQQQQQQQQQAAAAPPAASPFTAQQPQPPGSAGSPSSSRLVRGLGGLAMVVTPADTLVAG